MRRFFWFFALLPTVLLSCGGHEKSAGELAREEYVADSAALKIAVTPTLDCLPLFVASERGLFKSLDVDVRLRLYQAQMDQDTAMANGRVEALTTDLVRAERLQRHDGVGLSYVAVTPLSWQLVTNPVARIKQLSQMEDKMMAMTRYSATDMLSDMAVDSARLVPEHVFRIQVNDVSVRLNMLQTGIMDAMWLPEPQATVARQGGSPVIDQSSLRDLRLGVVAFSQKALADTMRRQQMERFVEAWNMACDSIEQAGLMHYRRLISEQCHVPEVMLDSLPTDIHFMHAEPPRTADIDRARAWLGDQ